MTNDFAGTPLLRSAAGLSLLDKALRGQRLGAAEKQVAQQIAQSAMQGRQDRRQM